MPQSFTITKWVAKDGREFDTEVEAVCHERGHTHSRELVKLLGRDYAINSDTAYTILSCPNFPAIVDFFMNILNEESKKSPHPLPHQ